MLLHFALMQPQLTAQCSTVWLPGQGTPGVQGEVLVSTFWDPDGAGPAPGVVVIGGNFTAAGGVLASNIAVYDPVSATCSPLGSGTGPNLTGAVNALTTLPNGDLVAGGQFTTAGGSPANRVARWNGSVWSPLGTGLNGIVFGLTTLPNGDVVAGGSFTTAGGGAANRIARWNGTTWSSLGTGMDNTVYTLQTLPNGDLVAGGFFNTAGGGAANRIARWNGAAWSPLGSGVNNNGTVRSLLVLSNGDLLAGGSFLSIGGVAANNIARWDGSVWSALGTGVTGGVPVDVYDVVLLANGDVVAGGLFTTAGGGAVNGIARWDGSLWSSLDTGVTSPGASTSSYVGALTLLPGGDLFVGGRFTMAGASVATAVALWNGTAWSPACSGDGLSNNLFALFPLPDGSVVAGGNFVTAGGVVANNIARWDGTSWSPLGTGMNGPVQALTTLPNGDVVAGGSFTTAGGVAANYIARWDGSSWSPLGAGTNGIVFALTTLPNGDVVAAGVLTAAGGAPASLIARWDGTAWSPLGSGIGGIIFASVSALTTLPNGDVVAGGFFTAAGGVGASNIARWNGTAWSPVGGGVNDTVTALLAMPNGDVVAGGRFTFAGAIAANTIARWNGATWSTLGAGTSGGSPAQVHALAPLPNGDLVAGGRFTTAGGVAATNIARWNGTSWSTPGSGVGVGGTTRALAWLAGGEVAAGGDFTTAGSLPSAYFARLATTCAATATTWGTGCPSSGGANTLVATTSPWVDTTFVATATGLPTTAIVLALTSLTAIPQGLVPLTIVFPQAGPGCDILTPPDILMPAVTTTGILQSSLFLPNMPPLVGVTFYHQMLPIEVDPQGAWIAFTATNALELTAGAF